MMQLIRPTPSHLPRYIAALERGWSPDTTRGPEAAVEALEKIRASADSLFATVDDAQAQGPSWTAPDGTVHARIPGLLRWMWDDAPETPNEGEGTLPGFIGSINLRWMPGHAPLPSHILGHLGYAVVPWQRRRGVATPRARRACCCPLPKRRACRGWKSRPTLRTSRPNASSPPTAACWLNSSPKTRLGAASRRCATALI
jgi:predicted acetyltransferase